MQNASRRVVDKQQEVKDNKVLSQNETAHTVMASVSAESMKGSLPDGRTLFMQKCFLVELWLRLIQRYENKPICDRIRSVKQACGSYFENHSATAPAMADIMRVCSPVLVKFSNSTGFGTNPASNKMEGVQVPRTT